VENKQKKAGMPLENKKTRGFLAGLFGELN
jgi:hypothetical protein